ncbi:TIR domain-containing protein [Vibrio algivorus]|uniref:TIR domain-containing protein n=1 Tax=Vibrio algivorus TaxID=1667024 RepID=A0A557PFL6_9VIBR|nr:TIR domain-containing protein [Vibrio algivorus]TVO39443.1 TIR domain-containing protein [Vibrio algivorus]
MARDLNIFISHSWSYHETLIRLRNLLNARAYFKAEFSEVSKDVPINSVNANYIKQRLGERIRNSNALLVIAGVYASHSDWMQWEMDTAARYGIPIIGVIPFGAIRTSSIVAQKSTTLVHWNTESIVRTIREYAR